MAAARNICFRLPLLLLLLLLAIFLGLLSSPCAADETLTYDLRLFPAQSLLPSPQSLSSGQSLVNMDYTLTMRPDCNLVLYDRGRAVWSTNTAGRGTNCYLSMQRDANLVIYSNNSNVVWATNVRGRTGSYVLALQRDRNLVVYGPGVWASGTNVVPAEGLTIVTGGAQDAAKNVETVGDAGVVANAAAAEGEPGLDRKIDMVTGTDQA